MAVRSSVANATPSVPLAARVVPSLVVGIGAFLSAPATPLGQRIITAAFIGWIFGLLAGVAYGIALKFACDLLKQSPPAKGWDLYSPPFVAGVLLVGAVWSLVAVSNAAARGRLERCLADASAQGEQWTAPITAYHTCDSKAAGTTAARDTD